MSDEPANLKLDRTAVEPPPFNPDPELAWDLAGNRRAIKRMKAYLMKLKAEADTEYAARPARQI